MKGGVDYARDDDALRGTGRTTNQLENAVKGAWFVWCTDDLYYPRMIAEKINRPDIRIVRKSQLLPPAIHFRGHEIPELVLDHDIKMTDAIVEGLRLVQPWVGRKTIVK